MHATTVSVLSDCHLARLPSDAADGPDRRFAEAVARVAAADPDLILLLGDIADDASTYAYVRTAEHLSRFDVPVVAIAGNHDTDAAVREHFPHDRDVQVGGWRIVALDSTVPGTEHGRVDIDDVIARLGPDTGQPTLLAMHHPPITTSTNHMFQLHGTEQLVAHLAQRTDVRGVISGHLHQAFEVYLGGVNFVGCSSTWYSLDHHLATYRRNGGHVGGLTLALADDGSFSWQRV